MTSLVCPECRSGLAPENAGTAVVYRCTACRGVAVNAGVLRRMAPAEGVQALWASLSAGAEGRPCPSCAKPLLVATTPSCGASLQIDVCRVCQILWFDADELAALSPDRQAVEEGSARPSTPTAAERLDAAARGEQAADRRLVSESLAASALYSFGRTLSQRWPFGSGI